MNNVVIINGVGRSGKDTFVNMCKLIDPKIENYSTIDKVKEVAMKMGWNDDKSDKGRKFLSDLKQLWDNYNGGATGSAVKRAKNYIKALEDFDTESTVFIHCREPHNIDKLKKEFENKDVFEDTGVNVITLFIENPNVPEITTNDSDKNVKNYDYDVTIINDGSLDVLRASARWFYYTYLVG